MMMDLENPERPLWPTGNGQTHTGPLPTDEPVNVYPRTGSKKTASRRPGGPDPAHKPPNQGFEAWFFVDILWQRWRWLATGALVFGLLAGLAGSVLWKRSFTAVAVMLRFDPIGVSDSLKPAPLSSDTFAGLLKAPELLQKVASEAKPPTTPEILSKSVFIKTDDDSDLVRVGVKAFTPEWAVQVANLYATSAVEYTKEQQQAQVLAIARNYLSNELSAMDRDVQTLQRQFEGLPASSRLSGKLGQIGGAVSNLNQQLLVSQRISPMTMRLNERLQSAIDELSSLTRKYTDAHPLVQQQRAEIQSIQQEIAQSRTNSPLPGMGMGEAALGGAPAFDPVYDVIRGKLQALDNSRETLVTREREAEAFAANPPGNIRLFAPAKIREVTRDHRWIKIGLLTVFGSVFGAFFAVAAVMITEFADDRLKSADDVRRVTGLPVLATLDALDQKSTAARENWAFRTWTMLQGQLSPSSNHGLVCGVTSSRAGEGRSTWIHLLAEAAGMSGFRVLTISTEPPQKPPGQQPPEEENRTVAFAENNNEIRSLTSNVLASPAEVTEQLIGPNQQPSLHIPLPGWVWNRERRKQWQEALEQWRRIDNLVILVELPPASRPESVLLGQNLPNLIWLSDSRTSTAQETRTHLETLRHARCKLVGAVFNRESFRPVKSRFPRWLQYATVVLACLFCLSVHAQEILTPAAPSTNAAPPPPLLAPAVTNTYFAQVPTGYRAEWQKHLTLGPGDILTFELYGQPELTAPDVFVRPDGTVGFLEAQNVMATGLTVDELRTNIDRELSQFRRAPRTIIIPVQFTSKKYYMLGKVSQRGTYTLDRPITIVEAVARAHGLETGLSDLNTLDLADFQHSFLVRRGKRIPIDFEKLFNQGDLSQNIALEPEDYLYFPTAGIKEVYVVGEVRFPGVVPWTPDLTVIGALAARGGFTDNAYKSRVLIIRGSLNHPQPIVADTLTILDARGQDIRLETKDIIYVSGRPFLRAEQLLDLGVTAFIQSATAEWTGRHVGPIINHPVFPSP